VGAIIFENEQLNCNMMGNYNDSFIPDYRKEESICKCIREKNEAIQAKARVAKR
jgi:hypothetical protein